MLLFLEQWWLRRPPLVSVCSRSTRSSDTVICRSSPSKTVRQCNKFSKTFSILGKLQPLKILRFRSLLIVNEVHGPRAFHLLSCPATLLKGGEPPYFLNCPKWNFSEHPRAQWYISKQFWCQINLQYITREDISNVYKCSGLQALFVAVFYTSVDLLCKNSYKSSSLLGYLDCFQSNHAVVCCNINFRSLCQIKREKLLCKQCLYIFVVLFARLQLFRCHLWPTFHPEAP